jgi:hypothetical protein
MLTEISHCVGGKNDISGGIISEKAPSLDEFRYLFGNSAFPGRFAHGDLCEDIT